MCCAIKRLGVTRKKGTFSVLDKAAPPGPIRKKRRHTLKAQVLLNWQTHEIIATAFGKGRTHDFKLFKYSSTHVHPDTVVLADWAI